MAENMNSGGGMTIDDFKEILKELGIGQNSKTAKIKIDTTQATEGVHELEEAFQKLWSSVTNNKTKSKYFQSLENATVDLKKTWNDLVSQIENDKKNGVFNLDKLYTTAGGSKQTSLLRVANAFEALGGNLQEVNPQIYDFVVNMREAMKIANPSYQFTVEGFSEAFEKFEELRKAGATIGDINFNTGFLNTKQDVSEIANLMLEAAENAQTASSSATEAYEKQGQAAEEAAQKIEKLTKAEMERQLKAEHENQEVYYLSIDLDDTLSDIEKYSKALDELKELQNEALREATNYQNDWATYGDQYGDKDTMKMYIQQYHQYTDEIEYVQQRLQESIHNYSPTANGDNAKELNILLLILRDLHGEIVKISSAISTIDGKKGLSSFSESIKEVGDISTFIDDQQFQKLNELFTKMESSLDSMKKALVDVGDGEEFSPLLKVINGIQNSISELGTSIKGIGLNLNIDFGSDKELELELEQKSAKALIAQKRLLEHLKASGAGGAIITQRLIDFELNDFNTTFEKVSGIAKEIANAREEVKELYGYDIKNESDISYWSQASSAMGEVTKVRKKMEASSSTNALDNLFGNKQELTEVVEQLTLIVNKLDEISQSTSDFKDIFKEGFNVSASVEEVEKLTNKIKELEDELSKVKLSNQTEVLSNQTPLSSTNSIAIAQQKDLQDELLKTQEEGKKARDIISQIGERKTHIVQEIDKNGKITQHERGQYSFIERLQDGQLKNVLVTYDEQTRTWREEVLSLSTAFEKVGKEIIDLDNKINQYENSRAKTLKIHPTYNTSADNAIIVQAEKRRQILLDTLALYDREGEYQYEIAEFEKRRAENSERLKNVTKKQENLFDTKQIEKFNSDWDEAIRINRELDEARQYSESYVISIQQALENEKREAEYIKERNRLLAEGEKQAQEYYGQIAKEAKDTAYRWDKNLEKRDYDQRIAEQKELERLSNESYQKELSLEREKNILLIKNLGATSDIIKANETRISQINKEIEFEKKKRLDSGLSNAQRQKALDEERLQLTKKLADAQETHNARLIEAQKLFDKNAVEKISKGLDRILVNKKQFQYNDAYKQELEVLQTAINEFNQKASLDIVSQEDIDELDIFRKKIEGLFEKFSSHTRNFNFQLADPKDIYKQMEEIQKILHDNTAMPSSLKDLFRALEQDYKLIIDNHSIEGTVANVEGLNTRLAELKYRLQESGKTGNSVFTLIGKKIKGLSSNFIAMYLSLYDIVRYIRQGVTIIKEYDDALTEMRKVTDESVKSLKEYQKASFDVANTVGTTATALQKSTADFLRIGESLEQAAASAQTATILFNVSEFESIDEATDSLVSMSAAFKELGKGEIVDVVNQLGNNFAISTDGLATALQNSASALKTAQNDFFEAAALTTAANTVTQDPDKVGAGLRTIALRLTGTEAAREELAEMGEDVDDFVVTTASKLDQKIKDLTKTQDKMGVSLLDMNGNYRSTYEVLLDIAKVWDTIAKEDLITGENRQNALLEMMAGKNRANILASILQSPDVLEEAYASALSADGSAQKELDKYLDSITGKVAKFQNQLQELATTTIDSEVVKNLIDFGTKLLSLLTDLIDKAGVLGTLGGIGGIILGAKNVGKRRSTMFHICFEYADRDKCFLY